MNLDVRKTLTDSAYVAIGIGVLGFQQAQVRRRELQQRLTDGGGCLGARAGNGRSRIDDLRQTVAGLAHEARGRVEASAQSANEWAQDLGTTVRDRIEPVVTQVQTAITNRAA